MRRIVAIRKHEFAIALLTTAAVVALGVEYGIVLAVVASIIDHLRHSYSPRNSVLVKSPAGHWQPDPIVPGARSERGLVVYRFGTSLYYANAPKLLEDITALAGHGGPLLWLVFDCAAIGDIDYTASAVLTQVVEHLHRRHVRFVISTVLGPVRQQLDRYGISAILGPQRLLRHSRRSARSLPRRQRDERQRKRTRPRRNLIPGAAHIDRTAGGQSAVGPAARSGT
jgi:sulfate permease, SulP family